MNKFVYLLLFLGLSILFFSCKEEEVIPPLDKEVRLAFPFEYWSAYQTDFYLSPDYTHLIRFNKTNYSDINSVTFYASIATESLDNTVEVELFNVTDSVSVNNTSLQASTAITTMVNYKQVFSGNILNDLPEKEIDLAIRLKSKNGSYVYVRAAFLLLRRD